MLIELGRLCLENNKHELATSCLENLKGGVKVTVNLTNVFCQHYNHITLTMNGKFHAHSNLTNNCTCLYIGNLVIKNDG